MQVSWYIPSYTDYSNSLKTRSGAVLIIITFDGINVLVHITRYKLKGMNLDNNSCGGCFSTLQKGIKKALKLVCFKAFGGGREVPIPNDIYEDLLSRKGEPFSPVFTQPNNQGKYTNMSRHRAWLSFKEQMDISMGAKFETVIDKKTKRKREAKVLSVVAPDLVPY